MIRNHRRFGWDLERLSSHLITNPCKDSNGMDLRNRMPDARVQELWAMYANILSSTRGRLQDSEHKEYFQVTWMGRSRHN
jgi:hypothetical protein